MTIHDLLADRSSTRAFDRYAEVGAEQLSMLLEAARWAPSASNTQPWRFAVGTRGDAAFRALADTLVPGNRVWAEHASALVLIAAKTSGDNGTTLPYALYDAGQAAAHLTVQAQALGLATHQMGGFDRDAVRTAFALPSSITPLVVMAVGVRSATADLPEPLAAREAAPRTRTALQDLLVHIPPDRLPLSA
jgi:nitroreductase